MDTSEYIDIYDKLSALLRDPDVYLHGRRDGRVDLRTGHVLLTTRCPDVALQYGWRSVHAVRAKPTARIVDDSDVCDFVASRHASGGYLPRELRDALRVADIGDVLAEFSPGNIVDSAGWWDVPAVAKWVRRAMRVDIVRVPGRVARLDAIVVLDTSRRSITAERIWTRPA